MPDSALPENLRGKKHWDYPPGLRWIPRGWTAFDWGVPEQILGTQQEERVDAKTGQPGPAPIPEAGSWQVSRFPGAPGILKYLPLYFAVTKKSGWHFRIGARWDDVDSYVQAPTVARRRYSGEPDQDTSTK